MIEERGEVYLKVSNGKNILLCVRDKCTNIDYVPYRIPVNASFYSVTGKRSPF